MQSAVSSKNKSIDLGFQEEQTPYDNGSQRARIWTEDWMRRSVYCPACGNDEVYKAANNKPALDFICPSCGEQYELKSKKGRFGKKVVNGAHKTLTERLTSETNPNFAFLSYDLSRRSVLDFFVVPKQFMIPRLVEPRKPLSPTARRAGWIGCNIRIGDIPVNGKIFIVDKGTVQSRDEVLQKWQRLLFLREKSSPARSWLIEVMQCCELIGQREFTIDDVYRFESRLRTIYPANNHVKEKMRQQLQVLRDHDFLKFLGRGRYRLN